MAASATNTSREIGAVFGVAVLGAIVNGRLTGDLAAQLKAIGVPPNFQSLVIHAVRPGAPAGRGQRRGALPERRDRQDRHQGGRCRLQRLRYGPARGPGAVGWPDPGRSGRGGGHRPPRRRADLRSLSPRRHGFPAGAELLVRPPRVADEGQLTRTYKQRMRRLWGGLRPRIEGHASKCHAWSRGGFHGERVHGRTPLVVAIGFLSLLAGFALPAHRLPPRRHCPRYSA